MRTRTQLSREDILAPEEYERIREQRRAEIIALKGRRRLEIGPVATCYFENYDTMWQQVHEMLRIEKGGEAQIDDELEAYNPLVPGGRELVCTVMFEIDDEVRRKAVLGMLGGVEETMVVEFAGETVTGVPEADLDRTTAEGKASAVQFIHLPFTDAQADAFRTPGTRVTVGFQHPAYGHMAVMPEEVRKTLAEDFT